MTDETKPQPIADKDLDAASGGVGMLLPAIQHVRDAGNKQPSTTDTDLASPTTVSTTKAADGSV
jgi:hypothetical protein